MHDQDRDTGLVGAVLEHDGRTLAVAESLTGGLLASAFARAPDSSKWFRGGIVAYSSAVKYDLLGVPEGPVVSEAAALAMARGAGRLLGADIAVAVTGAGGPDPQDGQRPGTVWAATWPDHLGPAVLLHLSGSPASVCEQACAQAVRMLRERLQLTAGALADLAPEGPGEMLGTVRGPAGRTRARGSSLTGTRPAAAGRPRGSARPAGPGSARAGPLPRRPRRPPLGRWPW